MLDAAAIAVDVAFIARDGLTVENGIALGLDVVSAALPFVPALGQAYRAGRTAGSAGNTVRRFVRQGEFTQIDNAIRTGDNVSLGRHFTPDNISDPRIATSQLAMPGTSTNPVVGYVDVPINALHNQPSSRLFGPSLVKPYRADATNITSGMLPGGSREVYFPDAALRPAVSGDLLTLTSTAANASRVVPPGLGAAYNTGTALAPSTPGNSTTLGFPSTTGGFDPVSNAFCLKCP